LKDAYFFPHDSNAKDDIKCILLIENLGMEGYGIFWLLVETLRDQPNYKYPIKLLPSLARKYNTTFEKVKQVILDYGLFKIENEEFFYSESLIKRMLKLEEKRAKNKQAAEIRWNKYRQENDLLENASAMQTHNICNANRTEENIIEKNRKENNTKKQNIQEHDIEEAVVVDEPISYVSIKNYWNSKNGLPKIKVLSVKRKEKIKLRINELSIEEFNKAIDIISESKFCLGESKSKWRADIDWLIANDNNIVKVLEGKYSEKKEKSRDNVIVNPDHL